MLMTTTHTSATKLSSTFGAHARQSCPSRLCGKLVGMHLTAAVAVAWRLALLARNIAVLSPLSQRELTTRGCNSSGASKIQSQCRGEAKREESVVWKKRGLQADAGGGSCGRSSIACIVGQIMVNLLGIGHFARRALGLGESGSWLGVHPAEDATRANVVAYAFTTWCTVLCFVSGSHHPDSIDAKLPSHSLPIATNP
jgi:hypothetical protein